MAARSSLQAAVPVHDDDTVETLSARILVEEHRIYPEAVRMRPRRRWRVDGRRFFRLPTLQPTCTLACFAAACCSYQPPGIRR